MDDRDRGQIIFWSDDRGYGFIRPDHADRDVFVHVSELSQEIRLGDRVTYEVAADRRPGREPKLCAKQVRLNGDDKAPQNE